MSFAQHAAAPQDFLARTIILNGPGSSAANPYFIEAGLETYQEYGAFVLDTNESLVSAGGTISGTINNTLLDTVQTVQYSFTGASTVTRYVVVRDTTRPVITGLYGPEFNNRIMGYEIGAGPANPILPSTLACTYLDSYWGSGSATVTNLDSFAGDASPAGDYRYDIDASDGSGNEATTVRVTFRSTAGGAARSAPTVTFRDSLTSMSWPTGTLPTAADVILALGPEATDTVQGTIEVTEAMIAIAGADPDTPATYSNAITVSVPNNNSPTPDVGTAQADLVIYTPAAASDLETVTLAPRVGGEALTTPYITTGLPFRPGVFDPATQHIEVRKAVGQEVVASQTDGRSNKWSDSTCAVAQLAFQGDSIAALGTQDYTLHVVSGSESDNFNGGETEATTKARITGTYDYKITLSNGVTGTSSLNDALGDSRCVMTRSGAVLREWFCIDEVGAHADLYVIWFARVNADFSVEATAMVINGWIQSAGYSYPSYTFDWELFEDVTSIRSGTVTMHRHSAFQVCDGTSLCWENQDNYFLSHSTAYLQASYSYGRYDIVDPDEMVIPAPGSYTPMAVAYVVNLQQPGEAPNIGPMTNHATRALLRQHKDLDQLCKIKGLGWGHVHSNGVREQATGQLAVWNNGSYAGDGLGSTDRKSIITELGAKSYTYPNGDGGYIGWGAHHSPEDLYHCYVASGDARYRILAENWAANCSLGLNDSRNTNVVDGKTYYGNVNAHGAQLQIRGAAWATRTQTNIDWVTPDDWPTTNMWSDVVADVWEYYDKRMSEPDTNGGQQDEITALGIWAQLHTQTDVNQNAHRVSPWEQDFLAMVTGLAYLRGYVAETFVTNFVTQFALGRAVRGHQARAYPHKLWYHRRSTNTYSTGWTDLMNSDWANPLDDGSDPQGDMQWNTWNSGEAWYPAQGFGAAGIWKFINAEGVGAYSSTDGSLIHTYMLAQNVRLLANNNNTGVSPAEFAAIPKYAFS